MIFTLYLLRGWSFDFDGEGGADSLCLVRIFIFRFLAERIFILNRGKTCPGDTDAPLYRFVHDEMSMISANGHG